MADGYIIYLLEFARDIARSHDGHRSGMEEATKEETEVLRQKFIGVFMWVIGFMIEQTFGKNGHVAAWCLLLYVFSYIEYLALKPISRSDTNNPLQVIFPESATSQ